MFESFVYSVYWTRKDYVVEGIFANSVAMLLNSLCILQERFANGYYYFKPIL